MVCLPRHVPCHKVVSIWIKRCLFLIYPAVTYVSQAVFPGGCRHPNGAPFIIIQRKREGLALAPFQFLVAHFQRNPLSLYLSTCTSRHVHQILGICMVPCTCTSLVCSSEKLILFLKFYFIQAAGCNYTGNKSRLLSTYPLQMERLAITDVTSGLVYIHILMFHYVLGL